MGPISSLRSLWTFPHIRPGLRLLSLCLLLHLRLRLRLCLLLRLPRRRLV